MSKLDELRKECELCRYEGNTKFKAAQDAVECEEERLLAIAQYGEQVTGEVVVTDCGDFLISEVVEDFTSTRDILDFNGINDIADEFKEVAKTVKTVKVGRTEYIVTVVPQVVTYCGEANLSIYNVTVLALDAADAMKQARNQRRNEEGRHCVSAKYSARVVK